MSFDAREKSVYGGNPVEMYRFAANASVWRFTSSGENIDANLDGSIASWEAAAFTRSGLEFSNDEPGGAVTITMPPENPVAALLLAETAPVPVTVTIYRLHYDDGESVVMFVGRVTGVSIEPGVATLRCMPLSIAFNRRIPRLYSQSRCNWDVYGVGCGVSKAAFKVSGTVMAFGGYKVRAAVFATKPDGWFTHGWLELDDLSRRYVLDHVAETITLRSPFPVLAIGQTIHGYGGCDGKESTCRDKFDNVLNHLGFERIPQKNIFTEGMS